MGWTNAWNKIFREVIWSDYELKKLMKLPPKTGILQFRDKYFIRAGFTNELLRDEVCRIVYADNHTSDTDVPNVKKKIITFDIFVKKEEMYNIGDDRLISRIDYIADRLDKLLRKERYLNDTGFRFFPGPDDLDLGTSTPSYARKTIAYYYMKVY